MEESKKYRWTLTGLIVMVVLNIGLIAFIWIFRPPPPPRVTSGVSTAYFEDRGLTMTESQRAQILRLLRDRYNTSRAIGSDITFKMRAFFRIHQGGDTTLTQEELDSLAADIHRRQSELDALWPEYNARMRQILDEEQRPKFDELITRDNSAIEQSRQMGRDELRRMFRAPGGRGQ